MKSQKKDNLVWIDLEMSGINPEIDHILEFSALITDQNLKVIDKSISMSIYQPDLILDNMDEWNTVTHTKTGLIERCRNSTITMIQAEDLALRFFEKHCEKGCSPLCGNSISTDKTFLKKYMPRVLAFLHYRIIDVSTIKELAKRWYPDCVYEKKAFHSSEEDIHESIEELKFYRKKIFEP